MKRILFAFLVCLFAQSGFAQVCNATFSTAMAPQNNNLLRANVNNSSTPYMTGTKFTSFYINWGDGSPLSYAWTGNNYHNYASQGVYHIRLIMNIFDSTTSGTTLYCSDTTLDSVHAYYSACATSFAISGSSPTYTVTATNPAGTPGMTYTWNWGDGSPNSTGNPASHTYASSGGKSITLTATNGICTYTNTQPVSVSGTCSNAIANFTSTITSSGVTFTSTSGNIAGTSRRYDWNFGDGNSSLNNTSSSISHTYASGGVYSVMLITKWYDSTTMTFKCIDSITKNVGVSNTISGYLALDSNTTVKVDSPEYKVWLIVFDSSTNILSAVDSTIVYGTNPQITPYQFNGVAAGTYRVKAKLLNGPTTGTGWVPTYHVSTLMWNTATTFYHGGGTTTGKWIMLQAGTATSGPGFVGGNVSAGANKGTANGIEGITMLLLDGNNNFVTSAVTDVNGNYSFSQLAPATYNVHPEDMGYTTTPVTISIVNNKPTITGINFERSQSQMTITPAATGISTFNNSALEFKVYPNPAKDKVAIVWNNNLASNADVTITDITGKKVLNMQSSNEVIEIKLDNLQKGFYFITVTADNIQETKKLMLQ
jgi:hypothetical protein